MSERAYLLARLMDEPTIKALKRRLSPDERADLILEIINPHRPLTTKAKARLAGVSDRAMRARKYAKGAA